MSDLEAQNDKEEKIIDNCTEVPKKLKFEAFPLKVQLGYGYLQNSYIHKKEDNSDKEKHWEYIYLSAFFSTCFHILFLVLIITGKAVYIFPTVPIFVCACIGTYKVFPFYLFEISTESVKDYLKKIINAEVELTKNYPIPVKYIVDVTGKIDIPKEYNFVNVYKIQYFLSQSLSNFMDKYYFKKDDEDLLLKDDEDLLLEDDENLLLDYKSSKLKKKRRKKKEDNRIICKSLDNTFLKVKSLSYHGTKLFEFNLKERFYNPIRKMFVINNKFLYFAKYGSIVFSILQIQWIFSLILYLLNYGEEYIVINPVKLLIHEKEYLEPDKTKINIHGDVITQEGDITLEINEEFIENLKEEYKLRIEKLKLEKELKRKEEIEEMKKQKKIEKEREKERKQKEKEERERKENTEALSLWQNDNYKIYVYREYNTVYLTLTVWEGYEISFKNKMELGDYNSIVEQEEYEGDTNLTTVYIPKGYYIKIIISNFEFQYNIKIGNGKFDKSFRYNK